MGKHGGYGHFTSANASHGSNYSGGVGHERMSTKSPMAIPGPPNAPLGACVPCGDDEESFNYAHSEYGSEGLDFKDWATSQAVDQSTVSNHSEFVKDRLSSNNTGRTWSPEQRSEMETTTPVPWAGLRRPQHVPVNNPKKVNEYNDNDYTHGPSLIWKTG